MLIIFKSSASGDVIMLEENGKQLLSLLGKNPTDAQGIVTVEQLPGALASVRTAIEADKARQPEQADHADAAEGNSGAGIRLFQRAVPLLELMERSLKDKVPVTWGV